MDIQEIISQLDNTQSALEVERVCCYIAAELGFENFLFVLFLPDSMLRSSVILLNNYPDSWMDKYLTDDLKKIDPIVRHVRSSCLPLFWREVSNGEKEFNKSDKQFMGIASDFGVRNGISLPCHGLHGETGALSMCTSTDLPISQEHHALSMCHMLLPYIHQTVKRLELSGEIKSCSLTKREKECLLWASEGKTAWEISQILSISERTVIFHINNSMNKTDSINRQQAIVKAILTGEITPEL